MKKIKVGLAGLGVVGKGVYEILQNKELLAKSTKADIEVTAVSSRSKKDFVHSEVKFYSDCTDIAKDAEIDVVIEVIGGEDISKNLIESSIASGKKVITANKALIASNGFHLAKSAEENFTSISFEASVAGSIPVIKLFREGFSGSEIEEFYAILNGTSNFILTKMKNENLDFASALKLAQKLGYAESDPSFDINGTDTAHKLTILSAIAFPSKPHLSKTYIEGIENITIDDILLAQKAGYKIKLLAIYKRKEKSVLQFVYPCLVREETQIAGVDDSFNAVLTKTSHADWNFIVGRGAGSLPTASAIVADLIDIANGKSSSMFSTSCDNLKMPDFIEIEERVGKYFLVISAEKNIQDLAKKLNLGKIEKEVSIQKSDEILYGFLTQAQKESEMIKALSNLDRSGLKSVKFIRAEEISF